MNSEVILKVTDLKTHFDVTKGMFSKKQIVKAVDGVSFELKRGETLGVIGESGCGKSTLGRVLIHLEDPTAGEILYHGVSSTQLKKKDRLAFCRTCQMIFQNPYSSLNPRMTVKDIVGEGLKQHGMSTKDADAKAS